MDTETRTENNAVEIFEPRPNWPVLQWLRGHGAAAKSSVMRKVLLVDPKTPDDALVLNNWRCEVTVMFSQRFQASAMYPLLNNSGIQCINADFFDLAQSWLNKFDLIVVSRIELLPPAIRQVAIRMYTNCLKKSGRIIVVAPEDSLTGSEMRAAEGILQPIYHETVFDPASEGFITVIAAERSSMASCETLVPQRKLGGFPA